MFHFLVFTLYIGMSSSSNILCWNDLTVHGNDIVFPLLSLSISMSQSAKFTVITIIRPYIKVSIAFNWNLISMVYSYFFYLDQHLNHTCVQIFLFNKCILTLVNSILMQESTMLSMQNYNNYKHIYYYYNYYCHNNYCWIS